MFLDGSFEQSQDLFLGAASGSLVLDEARGFVGGWTSVHRAQFDEVRCWLRGHRNERAGGG